MLPLLSGLLCRVLIYSSVVFLADNLVTVEFSSGVTAPNGVAFCFNDSSYSFSSSLNITSLEEGGSIFNESFTDVLQGSGLSSSFFSSASKWPVNPIEIASLYQILGSDPFYATTYANIRYDNIKQDLQGYNIQGLVSLGDFQQGSNCFVLTGNWEASTRYQITFNISNPQSYGAASRTFPALWFAALQYSTFTAEYNSTLTTSLVITVLGSKYGQVCPLRTQAQPAMSTLFDPCSYAVSLGLVSSGSNTNSSACLQALETNTGSSTKFPFNAPPITTYGLTSLPSPCSDLAINSATTLRLGGECIACSPGSDVAGACVCPASHVAYLVGNTACGPLLSVTDNVTTGSTLPAFLCTTYAALYDEWLLGFIPDSVINAGVLRAFASQASSLLDTSLIPYYNLTFSQNYIIDERLSWSPTRRYQGLKPNCNDGCTDDMFDDVFSHDEVLVYDNHFGAMNTLRLLGYILDQALHYPCPQLWNVSDPLANKYGPYMNELCQPMYNRTLQSV